MQPLFGRRARGGLAVEYPHVGHLDEFTHGISYDGVFEAGMTVCVESYMGAEGGAEGVKREQQVLITEAGVQLLSPTRSKRS